MAVKKERPSEKRRAALKATEVHKTPKISNITPIQRYYTAASNLRQTFETAVQKNKLDDAYVFGLRFAKFSTDVLPTHDYYKVNQPVYVNLRKQNQKDLQNVIDSLEQVVELMDLEELDRRATQRREEEALRKIREREEQMRKEEKERAETQDLIHRLNQLNGMFPDVPTGVGEGQKNVEIKKIPSFKDFNDDADVDADLPIGVLPPPIPFSLVGQQQPVPPSYDTATQASSSAAAPPSYQDLMQQQQRPSFANYMKDSISDLRPSSSKSLVSTLKTYQGSIDQNEGDDELTTFINPLVCPEHLVPASLEHHGEVENKLPSLPFDVQTKISCQEYQSLRARKRIEVFVLSTYQGRNPYKDSTNGCTVISPLVAVNHLQSEGPGISDMKIEQVIDDIAPGVLSRVRRKLGLSGTALIIPSDVHDFMVDEKILKQEMFVGVCGGNLLDSMHVNEFLNLLESGEEDQPNNNNNGSREEKKDTSKKVAAALFFHEHVVSILKVVLADGTTWYDLVDSLPSRASDSGSRGATRTRCKDRDSLQTLLHWYACQKFSTADAKYIDANEWDDHMGMFDPRVFQGFVWKGA